MDMMDMNNSSKHGMQMFFTNTISVPHLLFEPWAISEWWQYVIALIVCFVAAILNQFLVYLIKSKVKLPKKESDEELRDLNTQQKLRRKRILTYIWFFSKPFVYLLQNSLGYLVMLVTMTYNMGLFLAVVAGNTVGFTVFCMRANIVTEDCCAN